jgi:hypothetical protein
MMDHAATNPSRETSHAPRPAAAAGKVSSDAGGGRAFACHRGRAADRGVQLEPGESVRWRSPPTSGPRFLVVERLSGQVGVAIVWRELADPSALEPDPTLSIARSLPDATKGRLPSDRLVTVDFTVKFTDKALESGYEVVEHVPSGLAPIAGWWDSPTTSLPAGPRGRPAVTFCAPNDPDLGRQVHLRYIARR